MHRIECLPAEPRTVALYLSDLARHRVSTPVQTPSSGIFQAHQAAGFPTPTTDAQVRLVFQGIRRTLGSAPSQKNAAITAEVRAMVETLSGDRYTTSSRRRRTGIVAQGRNGLGGGRFSVPDSIRQAKLGRTVGLGVHGSTPGSVAQQVHDGNTVVVRAVGDPGVRLLGVDAPELSFQLPCSDTFVSIKDALWETFLTDRFPSGLPTFDPPLSAGLLANLRKRASPGLAPKHAKHAGVATTAYTQAVVDDMAAIANTQEAFDFFLNSAHDVCRPIRPLLCYINRDQVDQKISQLRPGTYSERLLDQGRVSAFVPGDLHGLQPFELGFLARHQPPDRWDIDLGKNESVLLKPKHRYRIVNLEDRLYLAPEFVPLFVQPWWKRQR